MTMRWLTIKMNALTYPVAAVAVWVCVFAFCGGGCARGKQRPSLPPPASAAIIEGQKGKDRVVVEEAGKIAQEWPEAKPHTDAQIAAVAAAPAADVERLNAQWETVLANRDAIIAKITKERDEARNATDRAIRIGGYALAGILVALGVASFFLAAQVPWLGPKISMSLIAAGLSVFAMVQAYEWTKAHPWITGITLLFLVAAGALAYANHYHSKDTAK